MYLHNIDSIKKEIEEFKSIKVAIHIDESPENEDLYNTSVDVSYGDSDSGTTFDIGANETWEDANCRAQGLHKELKDLKAVLEVNTQS